MATYTITINERTNSGKSLLIYLRSLGLIKEVDTVNDPDLVRKVRKSQAEIKAGKCKAIKTEDLWK